MVEKKVFQKPDVVTGNYYNKQNTKNPIERMLVDGFEKSITRMIQTASFSRVFEIGCGEGNNIPLIKRINPDCYYVAADIEERLLESALKQGADEVYLIDSNLPVSAALPYKNKSFDLVLLIEVLEHLKPEAAANSLADAARLCSAQCIATVPYEPLWRMMNMARFKYLSDMGNTPGHIQHFNRSTFRKLLESQFVVDSLHVQLPWLMISARVKD